MYLPKCNLHGFHVYKEVWSPIAGEQLKRCYERNNCYDCYAIVTTKHLLGRLANSTVVTCPERFPEQHAFSYFVLKSSTRTIEDLPYCKDDCKLLYKLQLRLILPKGTRQYLKV